MSFGSRPAAPLASPAGDHADLLQGMFAQLTTTFIRPGAGFIGTRIANERLLMLSGDHGGLRVGTPGAYIQGVPGQRFRRKVVIEQDCTFDGCDFVWQRGSNVDDYLVEVSATAIVTFNNCRFIKSATLGPEMVLFANGGKAVFTGCTFGPATATAGFVLTNPGAAVNVGVMGVNRTGQPPGNCTTIFLVS